jgi:hypothetical protein
MGGRIAPPSPPRPARRWPHVIWPTAAETSFTFWFLRLLSRKPRSVHTRPVSKWTRVKCAAPSHPCATPAHRCWPNASVASHSEDKRERSSGSFLDTNRTRCRHPHPRFTSPLVDTMDELNPQLRAPSGGHPRLERRHPEVARRIPLDAMAKAQLQGTNLGSTSGGRKILASVHTLASMPPRRILFFTNYGRYCICIGVDYKTVLSSESARYMNFIDWMARTSGKKMKMQKKTYSLYRNRLCINFALLARC